ncbi:MAG: MBOAT family protein [Muribaculaceae bacterium]|nr:MBOAT family protein [Muribaculaceae bacterium]
MLFSSIEFAIFLPIVFYLYWALSRNLKVQNIFVVATSYFFYAWWDWRFLGLIIFTTISTYLSGILISKASNKTQEKLWMWLNIGINISILGFFKYFNFFCDNIVLLASWLGLTLDWFTLKVLLPIGISFYTFQAISYTVDVYKRKIEATHNVVAFAAYIAFFPQLVAGPIEKATKLLPQFLQARQFNYKEAVIGMRQILWGLSKKILIADCCAHYADKIFGDPSYYAGSSIIIAIILFLFQIYADYSGYSDIAIGTGRLFGIKLSTNFSYPLFSRSISEFWRRWNITLMQWFRDYIYIPLGGSHKGIIITCANTIIVFFISGLWHGAAWKFIVWGLLNALLILPTIIMKRKDPKTIATLKDLPAIIITFTFAAILFVIFRCDNLPEVVNFFSHVSFDPGQWAAPTGKTPFLYIIPMIIIEWISRRNEFALAVMPQNRILRYGIYWLLLILIIYGTSFESQPYLYFQF